MLTYLFYLIVLGFIKSYKWIELQVLKPFKPIIRRKGIKLAESIGVAFHFPGEKGNDSESRIIEICKGKYDRVIHINVNDPDEFFLSIANKSLLGLGESYMKNVFDFPGGLEDFSELTERVLDNNLLDLYRNKWNRFLEWLELSAINLQTPERAFMIGRAHYDTGNDLFERMLGPSMNYSCAYWAKADNLDQAQEDKMDLIAKKLDLKPGMKVLDIGCGWGTLCKYLAKNYGVTCVGVTVSEEGVAYGKKINEGLPVEIRLQDYRELNEKFDRIVSVGMFEHVGFKNHKEYMKVVNRCLTDDGIFLLHTIGLNHPNLPRTEPFTHHYIFPNGNLPTPDEITKATKGLFVIEDWHNFGRDYAKTLEAWRVNFLNAWPELEATHAKQVNGMFFRMWTAYLSYSVGAFRCRKCQLWQVVLSKDGLKSEYRAAR